MQNSLPYFGFLLSELEKGNATVETSFGRHVHWGYWENPNEAVGDAADYARAAEQLTLELCRLADIAPGQRVLDVGCGFGGTVASLNERFSGLDLVGLNIEERQLDRARAQVVAAPGNSVAFQLGDACAMPFEAASVDRMLAVECVFHFPDRETFFQGAARVLRPGGLLVLSDFVPTRLLRPFCPAGSNGDVGGVGATFGNLNVQYTLSRYRAMARRAGLIPVVERNITRNTLPTYRYLQSLVGSVRTAQRGIGFLQLLARCGLLGYYLLAFRKPGP